MEPYRSTGLGRLYERVIAASASGSEATFVIEDFSPYAPSAFAPAAFIGAPIRVAGATVGVLAMQIAIREVDRVMTGQQEWQDDGLGRTGQAYAVGADNTLRSDLRQFIEDPETFYRSLATVGTPPAVVETIKSTRTTVLTLPSRRDVGDARHRSGCARIRAQTLGLRRADHRHSRALAGRTFVSPSLRSPAVEERLVRGEGFTTSLELTDRQREVLQLLAQGKSAKQIGVLLGISPRTAETHKYKMMDDLGLSTTAELVRYAIRHGLVAG